MFGGAKELGSCTGSLQQPAAAEGFLSVEAKYSGEKNRVRSLFKRENDLNSSCSGLLSAKQLLIHSDPDSLCVLWNLLACLSVNDLLKIASVGSSAC